MKANILYIGESNISNKAHALLRKIKSQCKDLYIFVYLKKQNQEFEPMIIDVSSIRKEKISKKIQEIVHEVNPPIETLKISVLENRPRLKDIIFDTEQIKELNIYHCESQESHLQEFTEIIQKKNKDLSIRYFSLV